MDGLSNNDDAAGLPATYFSQEVFGEFQVVTSNGTAEFGRAEAGFINLSTRSGTNQLHGRAYGFLRNQFLDAVNPLSGTKLPLTWPQYGISAGGPLRRNRTFFFVNYERTRQSSAGFVTISPASVTAINNALNAFASPGVRVATGEYPATLKTDTFFSRVDHQVSKRDQIFARYNFYHLSQVNAQSNGTLSDVSRGTNLFTFDHVIAVNNVFTISPRTFNETRAQFFRYPLSAPPASTGVAVNIPGVALFGPASIFPSGRKTTGGELVDALTFESGRHALKLGVDALYQRIVIMQPGNVGGSYTFSSLANFQARRYAAFLQDFGNPTQGQTSMNIGMFAQDEWRLRHNFTVNAGVRYDIQSTPSILDTDFNNIAPRIGFVWSPYGNQKTVIRAGYGLFYGRIPARHYRFGAAARSGPLQNRGPYLRADRRACVPQCPACVFVVNESDLSNDSQAFPGRLIDAGQLPDRPAVCTESNRQRRLQPSARSSSLIASRHQRSYLPGGSRSR